MCEVLDREISARLLAGGKLFQGKYRDSGSVQSRRQRAGVGIERETNGELVNGTAQWAHRRWKPKKKARV